MFIKGLRKMRVQQLAIAYCFADKLSNKLEELQMLLVDVAIWIWLKAQAIARWQKKSVRWPKNFSSKNSVPFPG